MCMIKLQIHFWTLLFINALAKEINMLCHLQPQMYPRSPSIDGGMWAIILIFINALAKYINIYNARSPTTTNVSPGCPQSTEAWGQLS